MVTFLFNFKQFFKIYIDFHIKKIPFLKSMYKLSTPKLYIIKVYKSRKNTKNTLLFLKRKGNFNMYNWVPKSIKTFKFNFLKNYSINTLRDSRFFNKSKYSRNRQICINITLLGLYINILFINELHRTFYNISINWVDTTYIFLWVLLLIIFIKKNIVFSRLK